MSGHPGLNRSSDGAVSFDLINDGLPGTDVHAFGAGDAVLYGFAIDGGFFASLDDGATWELRASEGLGSFFGRVVVDPADDDHLFVAAARNGVGESTDGGRTWRAIDTGMGATTWLSASADNLGVLVASGPDGAARSLDGGDSWSRVALPAGASLVEVSPGDPDVLYEGSHSGTSVRVQISRDGGATWAAP